MKRKNCKYTYGLISLLVVVFLLDFLVLNKEGTKVLSVDHLLKGNQWGYLTQYGRLLNINAMSPEWWRLFTCMFLHAGIPHLVVNCIGLYCIGSIVERRFGSKRFVAIYLLCGIGSALVTTSFTYGSVGASGAIYGMGGTLLILIIKERKNIWSLETILKKILIIAYLILPNLGGVNTLISHEVGLIIGILLGLIFSLSVKDSDDRDLSNENMKQANS
ncbi:rhomboid family intramembrane serine protease [Anaerosporobacter sp.]